MSDDILTEDDVAALLGCSVGTVRERTLLGDLPGVQIGRSWRYPRPALLQALTELAMAERERRRRPPAMTNLTLVGKRKPPALPTL